MTDMHPLPPFLAGGGLGGGAAVICALRPLHLQRQHKRLCGIRGVAGLGAQHMSPAGRTAVAAGRRQRWAQQTGTTAGAAFGLHFAFQA